MIKTTKDRRKGQKYRMRILFSSLSLSSLQGRDRSVTKTFLASSSIDRSIRARVRIFCVRNPSRHQQMRHNGVCGEKEARHPLCDAVIKHTHTTHYCSTAFFVLALPNASTIEGEGEKKILSQRKFLARPIIEEFLFSLSLTRPRG